MPSVTSRASVSTAPALPERGFVRTSAGPYSVFVMATRPSDNLGDDPGYLVDEAGWNLTAGSGTSSFAAKVFEKHAASGATLMSMKIGKSASSALNDFGGDIAEVLVFDRQLSNTEIQQIQGYLAHRWRATDSLVSSHPYKEIPPVFDNSPKLSPKPTSTRSARWSDLDARRHGRSDRVRVWFDANDSSTVAGTQITEWKDKSGNDRHASGPVGSPAYLSSGGPNGMPAVQFFVPLG